MASRNAWKFLAALQRNSQLRLLGCRTERAGPPVRNGIELSLAEGHAVHAVHEGTVAFADLFTGYGTVVILQHEDDTYTVYGHLGSATVHKGDRIEAGHTVGLAGRNPSLYFELRVDGKAVDPLQWLKR